MVSVAKRDEATLLPIIRKYIAKGSIINSDCWKAYNNLKDHGYQHITVNHSMSFVDEESGACTNVMEGSWNHAKKFIPKFGAKAEYLDGYLASFLWRRRHDGKDLFSQLLNEIAKQYNFDA